MTEKSLDRPTLVVGIGASAGGLESFTAFFAQMPNDSGIAFVLLPHLSASHRSLMPELISNKTNMTVLEATHNQLVKPNHIYVLPPAKNLEIKNGCLQLTLVDTLENDWIAIDNFLTTLGNDQKERSVAIILSGTGSHGTLGFREIKLNGGIIIAQEPSTTQFNQMPANAICTGLVDLILPPEEMAKALIEYSKHPYLATVEQQISAETQTSLQQILDLLKKRVKHDFSCYRKNMLLRRIQRRMSVCHSITAAEYMSYLEQNDDETTNLLKDLLIGVTTFFRDEEAFHVLEQRIIPELVAVSSLDNPARIWVPACATGEEAYSIAILFLEGFERAQKPPAFQIFASDIDKTSLKTARLGIYSEDIIVNINPQRRERHFMVTSNHHNQVNRQLRDCVVFAEQNLVCDAPFSRLDFISCRNLLIYLQPELQAKVISLFHFSLRTGGYLLLGPSESTGRKQQLFHTISKQWRLFKSVKQAHTELLDIPARTFAVPRLGNEQVSLANNTNSRVDNHFADLVERALLANYAPAAVLINRNYEVLHFQGPTVNYLEFPAGLPTNDLTALLREGLKTRIRTAVHRAITDNKMIVDTSARVKRHGHYSQCTVTIRPFTQLRRAGELFLITFEEGVIISTNLAAELITNNNAESLEDSDLIRQLEDELNATRVDLQSNIEELRASNEEVMSMNEELQSANEELETSKEELQSSNEELITVNTELQSKLEDIEKSTNDISNLLSSTDIATIFLNRKMQVMLFNPATNNLLNIRQSDIGRPINDFSAKVTNHNLIQDAKEVLEKLIPVERDVWTNNNKSNAQCFLRRIVPYRSSDEQINGVIVTFINVTERHQYKQLLEQRIIERTNTLYEREERLKAIMKYATEAIIVINPNGLITDFNNSAEQIFGYSSQLIVGKNINQLLLSPYRSGEKSTYKNEHNTQIPELFFGNSTLRGIHQNGVTFPLEMSFNRVDHLDIFVGIFRDLSEKQALYKAMADISTRSQEKIGIDLHDTVGQRLTGINLLMSDLKRKLNNLPNPPRDLLEEISLQIREAIGDTRDISHGLAPISLTPQGLEDAFDALAETCNKSGVKCLFELTINDIIRDRTVAMEIYRIAQEAINNALKHARAHKIVIKLSDFEGKYLLEINDDGRGFTPSQKNNTQGIGLNIMSYRANSIGGLLKIDSAPGKGTKVSCWF